MEWLKILLLSVLAAIAYGILQDQITARVCVEYFTVAHPPVFDTQDPTALAFGWGTIATWWVGLILGVPLASLARFGARPKLTALDLVKPLLVTMACVGLLALVAGLVGFSLATAGKVWVLDPMRERIPPEKHVAFLADAFAHTAVYAGGFLGGVLLWVWTWRQRRSLSEKVQSILSREA
jgi:hypothetical protein